MSETENDVDNSPIQRLHDRIAKLEATLKWALDQLSFLEGRNATSRDEQERIRSIYQLRKETLTE